MSKMYIFSTLSNDHVYGPFVAGGADVPMQPKRVLIKGGAGVVGRKHMVTPRGVGTAISEADLIACRADPVFVMHEKNGFIVVSKSSDDAEKVASTMEGRDLAAPLVEQDFTRADPVPSLNKELPPLPAPIIPAKSAGRMRGRS